MRSFVSEGDTMLLILMLAAIACGVFGRLRARSGDLAGAKTLLAVAYIADFALCLLFGVLGVLGLMSGLIGAALINLLCAFIWGYVGNQNRQIHAQL
jgi:hypothetical protein